MLGQNPVGGSGTNPNLSTVQFQHHYSEQPEQYLKDWKAITPAGQSPYSTGSSHPQAPALNHIDPIAPTSFGASRFTLWHKPGGAVPLPYSSATRSSFLTPNW
jgi:hypothetical protein